MTEKNNKISAIEESYSAAIIAVAVLLGGLFGLPAASGQDSDSVTIDVGGCVELESAEDRFACYEAQVDEALSVTVDVGECIGLASAADRLACYEVEVDVVVEETEAAAPDVRIAVSRDNEADQDQSTSTGTSTSTSTSDSAEGGTRRERRAARQAERHAAEQARESEVAEGEYRGTITAIRERIPNNFVITLDNGQIWEQSSPKNYPLRPGLEVRIYPTRWGASYRLAGLTTGGYIQVQRIR